MASGFISKKKDRIETMKRVGHLLHEAAGKWSCINYHEPDDPSNRKYIEEATDLLHEAAGQRDGDFVDTIVPLGWTDILEHYYS